MPPGGELPSVIAVDDDSPGPPPAPSSGSRGAAAPKDKPYKAMPRCKAKPLPGALSAASRAGIARGIRA
eukprot:10232138-Alexandrium_andersonii.AAC.1